MPAKHHFESLANPSLCLSSSMQPPKGPYTSEAIDGGGYEVLSVQCHLDPAAAPYVDCCSKPGIEGRSQCWQWEDASEQGSLHVVPCKVTCSQLVPGSCTGPCLTCVIGQEGSHQKQQESTMEKAVRSVVWIFTSGSPSRHLTGSAAGQRPSYHSRVGW